MFDKPLYLSHFLSHRSNEDQIPSAQKEIQ